MQRKSHFLIHLSLEPKGSLVFQTMNSKLDKK